MQRLASMSPLVVLICLLCFASTASYAQQGQQIVVLTADNVPLASLRAAVVAARAAPAETGPVEVLNFSPEADLRTQVPTAQLLRDPLLLPFAPSAPASVPTRFDGSDNSDNATTVTPPDTNGEVSSDAVDRFVQMINLVTTIFDKNGVEQGVGAFPNNVFWSGFGGVCETTNRGDPVVLYDEQADRWIVSQFAFDKSGVDPIPPFMQCVAVSRTGDPLASWDRYAWNFSSVGFNDYPHFGISTDAVGISVNLFAPPGFGFSGSWIGAIDKNCMYTGAGACELVGTNLGTGEFGFLPLDHDNFPITSGFVPAQFGTAMSATGLFDVWTITPDFTMPPNTTVVRTARVPIAPFDSDICGAARERCIPHPGTSGPLFDFEALSGRLMHRAQVRDFGTHLSLVASHTIDVDAAGVGALGRAGVRWYELRSMDRGATWSLHQQGSHGPSDGLHRWMPSIAMNPRGDIGLGFIVSNSTTNPEIRVTGQSAGSGGNRPQTGAPGVLNVGEASCRAGDGGTGWGGRSGDYSATSVDPTSGSFWHTNEFSGAAGSWGTAVCEFVLPGPGVYVLDGFGGLHSGGGAPMLNSPTPYFGFDVARDMELGSLGFYVLDGFGGLHSGGGAFPMNPGPPYFGFDAGVDLELASSGFYVLDIFGGVHAGGGAPVLSPGTPYFGFDAARDLELAPTGFYVFDAWGGLHTGGGAPLLSPLPPYFGFDASEDIELTVSGLYALDSFGGVHAVGGAPALGSPPPYFGFDIARDMELAGSGLYILDGSGVVHAANGAAAITPAPTYFGFDIAKDLEIR